MLVATNNLSSDPVVEYRTLRADPPYPCARALGTFCSTAVGRIRLRRVKESGLELRSDT